MRDDDAGVMQCSDTCNDGMGQENELWEDDDECCRGIRRDHSIDETKNIITCSDRPYRRLDWSTVSDCGHGERERNGGSWQSSNCLHAWNVWAGKVFSIGSDNEYVLTCWPSAFASKIFALSALR